MNREERRSDPGVQSIATEYATEASPDDVAVSVLEDPRSRFQSAPVTALVRAHLLTTS